ncbi:MAG: TetR/AcrR family transcriptional regulator [Lachnospiraceae bacterium]|nr:TetR/AcrR family transcriptional regulator [Lachnospiraceae bacterium]
MNTSNNKRYQETEQKIIDTFLHLLQEGKKLDEIYVQDICRLSGISRPSFYTHYEDINDLILKIEQEKMEHIHTILMQESVPSFETFLKYFQFLKENRSFYIAFFSTNDTFHITTALMDSFVHNHKQFFPDSCLDLKTATYLMISFSASLKSLAYKWLLDGCEETPDEMVEILEKAYCTIPALVHAD